MAYQEFVGLASVMIIVAFVVAMITVSIQKELKAKEGYCDHCGDAK